MREFWTGMRQDGVQLYWYRGLLAPIYENPRWQRMAINMLAEDIDSATEIGEGWNSVTHQLKGVWLQGTVADYYEYLARNQQAEMSEDDHQA